MQRLLLLAGVVLVDVFLVWFGIKLLTFSHNLSSTEFFILGLAACFGGLFTVAPPNKVRVIVSGTVFGLGLYFFLRAFGVIQSSVLSTTLGIASIIAAVILAYIVVGTKPSKSTGKTDTDA